MSVWTQLHEFDGVDLSESYVLGWRITPIELLFDLDVALTPEHPRYHSPRSGERGSWLRGSLRFPKASQIRGLAEQSRVPGATDATGARDYGNIDELSWADGEAHVVGEFGDGTLRCERPYITLSGDGTSSV
jgi:hypothetical protein